MCILALVLPIMTEKVPRELLCDIFAYVADSQPGTRREGYTYERHSGDVTDYLPSSGGYSMYTLRPLTLVCKLWKQTAEILLYSSISLGDSDGKSIGQLCRLVKTLEQTPRLALMVKKLQFSTMICDKEESKHQAKCIALCPYVTHVSLQGYDGHVLDEFHKALAGLIYLRELKISNFSLRDAECNGFCSVDKLLFMMMGWKDMEAITFHTPTSVHHELQWNHEQVEEEPSVPSDDEEEPTDEAGVRRRAAAIGRFRDERQSNIPIRARLLDPIVGACPEFKRWSWDSVYLNSIQLRVLAAIAPNLQKSSDLSVIHNKGSEPERLALYDALGHWGRTLTSFTCIPNSCLPLVDDSLADQLVQLRELETNRSFISYETLGRLESLESLTFYLFNRMDDRVDGLTEAVTTMPSLRILDLRSMDVVDPSQLQMVPVLRPESVDRLSTPILICGSASCLRLRLIQVKFKSKFLLLSIMAEKLPPELLGKIFTYIAQSRPGRRRRGYSYEDTDSDQDQDQDEEYGDSDEEQYEEDSEQMELDYEEFGMPFNIAQFEFYPTYALRPLILVCKAWKGIAEHLLYASISLGSDGDDDGAVGAVQVSCLTDTLEQTPRLALMVKKLRFSTMNCSKEESQNQAKIMVLCPNTTHITLHGYNGYVLDEFLKALTGLTYLRYLDISRYNLRDTECDGFCSFDKLLFMMMGWRDIETIIFHNNANAYDGLWWKDDKMDEEPAVSSDDEEEPDPDDQAGVWRHNIRAKDIIDRRTKRLHNIPIRARILNPIVGACSKFKRFEWKECFLLNPVQLHALATIAPNLEETDQLSTLHTEPERAALYTALEHWGESLTTYTCTPHSKGPPLVDDFLAQRLVRLRKLRTNGSFIGAEALAHLGSLKSLTFYRTGDNVDGLAIAVDRMSSLRTLELRSMDELKSGYSGRDRKIPAVKPESMERLGSACERRGVALSVKEYKM